MPTWIFAHSESLCNFLVPLLIHFSPAQQRHALNFIEALLVSSRKHKTLRHLTGLLRLPHADEFALADFFRASHWDHATLQQAVTRYFLQLVNHIQARSGWQLVFLKIDDALCRKDIAEKVYLSEKTVRNYVSSILSKLHLSTRAEAAAYAVKHRVQDHLPTD